MATKRRYAISAVSNQPRLSGLRRAPFSVLVPVLTTTRAPLSVRTAAGTSTKSSLFHTWTRDTRDHPILGTRGIRAQLRHELAGLGGGASFYKAEGSLHASRVLHPGLVS